MISEAIRLHIWEDFPLNRFQNIELSVDARHYRIESIFKLITAVASDGDGDFFHASLTPAMIGPDGAEEV